MTAPAERRPMAALERERARALSRCTFLPGSWEKRFARDMARLAEREDAQITDGQGAWLLLMCWRYRRQITKPGIVPETKPQVRV